MHRWLLSLLILFLAAPVTYSQGWRPGFHSPGLNDYVSAVVVLPNGDLVAAGTFTNAGGHPAADYIARWNGRTWQALGTGLRAMNNVEALVAAPDGTLFAAGTRLDSSQVLGLVFRWDGHSWQQLGPAMHGSWVSTLTLAVNGDLLAVTNDRSVQCGVLRWQGYGWKPLAPNAPASPADYQHSNSIVSLVTLPTGDILAAGHFPTTPPNGTELARWTGSAWQPLAPFSRDFCRIGSLAVAANGDLLGSTTFYDAQGHYRFYVARWDSHSWQQLGADLPSAPGRLLVSPAGTVLVTCSARINYGTGQAATIARWDGTSWHLLALGKDNTTVNREALAVTASGNVIVRDPVYSLTRWDGRAWHALADQQSAGFSGTEYAGRITALAVAPNRDVLLAGAFYPDSPDTLAPHQTHLQVYRWDGRQRHCLGTGLRGDILALAVAPSGDVLAGGSFVGPGLPDSIRNIARWNGHAWQAVGGSLPFIVRALAVLPDGNVVAGGTENLARWNGRDWQLLPLPFPGLGTLNHIQALAVAPNGDLLVGGSFSRMSGTVEASVLRWDGHVWQPLVSAAHTFVQCLAVTPRGQLVIGTGSTSQVHSFSESSGDVIRLRSDGRAIQNQHFGGYVHAVAVAANGDIVAGGGIEGYLVRGDDRTWQPLGTGVNGEVWAIAVAPNGDIIAGGDFTATGDGAQSLGLWGIYCNR